MLREKRNLKLQGKENLNNTVTIVANIGDIYYVTKRFTCAGFKNSYEG